MSDIQDIIIHYLDGTATPEEKNRLLRWLKESVDHQQEFQEIRDLWLSATLTLSGNDPVVEKALQRLRNRIQPALKTNKLTHSSLHTFLKIVALFLLAFGLNYSFFRVINGPRHATVINRLITSENGKGRFVLPDSTVVWLNKNTILEYPDHFNSSQRTVKLQGEAYFEVFSNPASVFRVGSGDIDVEVTGTSFVVQNYEKCKTIEAILLSGKVFVENNRSDDRIELFPNQRFSWEKGKAVFNVDSVNVQDYISWIHNRLAFDNHRFSDILTQMQQWYGIDIICPVSFAYNTHMTFTIRDESIEEILKAIRLIVPIDYRWEGDSLYINPKKGK